MALFLSIIEGIAVVFVSLIEELLELGFEAAKFDL